MNLNSCRRTMVILGVIACLLLALGAVTGIYSVADPAAASPAFLHVKPTATGVGDCSDWPHACTLETALGMATDGDEVWVAEGTHKPTTGMDRTATFQLIDGVALYGGFAGIEASRYERDWTLHETILSGDIGMAGDITDNSYHVVTGSGTDATAVLDGFTITGGNADSSTDPDSSGGGMHNEGGNPTLTNLIFTGNSARGGAAIFNYQSSPTLTKVTFSANEANFYGGGMFNSSSNPTLTNVIFSGNSSYAHGGGMYNTSNSSPTLTDAAFTGNSAPLHGGAIYNGYNSSPTLTNVTFSGNSAEEGGGMYGGPYSSPTLTNITFSGNSAEKGGGMFNKDDSSPTVANCILWGNTALDGAQIYNDGTSAPTISYSLVEGGCPSGASCDHILDADPQFVDADGFDDIVGTLDDNLHLQATSPAIDAGDNSAVPSGILTDLDGRPRIVNGTVDMGAYEHQLLYVKVGTSGDCSSWANACDLQTALGEAWEGAGDEIWVAGGIYKPTSGINRYATFQLANGVALYGGFAGTETSRDARDWTLHETILSGDIIIPGVNIDNSYHVVTGSGTDGTAVLDGFTITGGYADGPDIMGHGGGMYNSIGSPNLANVTFTDNSANSHGGGMYNSASHPTLTNVTFSANEATLDGGGMYNFNGSSPTLTNVTFNGNSADLDGGGICNDTGNPTLTNVTFSDNSAEYGGGIYNSASSPTLTNVTFSGDSADAGGAMYSAGGSPTLTDVTFTGNSAVDYGGGMYNWDSSPNLTDVTFSGNSADLDGGGMYNDGGSPTLTNVTFDDNSADYGAGMYNWDSSPTLTKVTFSSNSALSGSGGGMSNHFDSNPTMTDVTFSGNDSGSVGGGMANDMSSATLINVSFSANTANYGGGMYNSYSSPNLTDVTFVGNSAYDGGGMYNSYSSPSLTNVTFDDNSADYGAGMYNDEGNPTLTNVAFIGNSATSKGGGMLNYSSEPTLTNVIFSGNSAGEYGGGIYNDEGSPTLTNVTFSGNSATDFGGGICDEWWSSPMLTNCILWGNTASEGEQMYDDGTGTTIISYSLVEGGCPPPPEVTCDHVSDADPQFEDADGPDDTPGTLDDNLRLQLISPAIDAGDNTADLDGTGSGTTTIADVATDLDGYPRCVDIPSILDTGVGPAPIVDMGAYEAHMIKIYLPLVLKSYGLW